MVDWSFPKKILLALFAIVLLGAYPLVKYGSSDVVHASIIGVILATANVLFGYATIEYSVDKSATTFLKFVLGGMGLRLLVLGLMIALFIEGFHVHVGGLVWSMGICYVVFLVLEILFLQRKVSIKQQQ